jgi:hypothetical protein
MSPEVSDDLGRRRHLDDVAEHVVDGAIGLGDIVPARLDAERARLLLQVGELAARHFVQIHFRRARFQIALERDVLRAHRLPIEADTADRLRIESGVALAVAQRLDERAEAGLRSRARHRIHRRIDGVDARVNGGEDACSRDA